MSAPYTSGDKWVASFIVGLLFLLISSPFAYTLTNSLSDKVGLTLADQNGCPNLIGLLVHAIIFLFIFRFMMNRSSPSGDDKPYTSKDKWIVSLAGGLLFLLISSPFLYEASNSLTSLVGFNTASPDGCPNTGGLIIHTALFITIVRILMR